MTDDPNKPQSPWKLNSSRVVLLILGVLILIYVASALLGGLGNYQQLKEAAQGAKSVEAPSTTTP